MRQSWDNHETVYYSTPVADLADMSVLVCLVSQNPNGWPQGHGPTNVGVMVKNGRIMEIQDIETTVKELFDYMKNICQPLS